MKGRRPNTGRRSNRLARKDGGELPQAAPVSPTSVPPTPAFAIAETAAWLDRVVLGLGLCPFAAAPRRQQRIRFVHTAAADAEALLGVFGDEVGRLLAAPASSIETTLLIHPQVLADFADYNDFLDLADAALEALGATGVLQVASFHPQYRFAGSASNDIGNATNRSPWPTLQLLREASVGAVSASSGDSERIYETNIATMRALGANGWDALRRACRRDAETTAQGPVEPEVAAPGPEDRPG